MTRRAVNEINGPLIPGGWSRWKDIAPFIPFSRETYRLRAKTGYAPKPVNHGGRAAIYFNDEVNMWLNCPETYQER